MPIKKEREYRALAAPLTVGAAAKRIQTDYYVEGYATTFDTPYLLYEFEDGTKIYERIDAHALDGADMGDVIMQYDHAGRVFARQSNKTLILVPDHKGLFSCRRFRQDGLSTWAIPRHRGRHDKQNVMGLYGGRGKLRQTDAHKDYHKN